MYFLLLSQSNWAKRILTADTAAGKCRITTHTVRSGRFLLECGIEIIWPLKDNALKNLCKCGEQGAEIDFKSQSIPSIM